ncbi:MAG: hypothetical protein M1399_04115 [Actinobacteria bacterium]|nr:hypothetical protein [Actinomycetota bacterium]MCL5446925.1 hypothetical protein [Actinomycetota bacterium]
MSESGTLGGRRDNVWVAQVMKHVVMVIVCRVAGAAVALPVPQRVKLSVRAVGRARICARRGMRACVLLHPGTGICDWRSSMLLMLRRCVTEVGHA